MENDLYKMYDDLSVLKVGIVQFPKVVIARWYICLNYSLFSLHKNCLISSYKLVYTPSEL